jgi:hypothetical protein
MAALARKLLANKYPMEIGDNMHPIKLRTFFALTSLCLGTAVPAEARSYVVKHFDTYTVRCSSIEANELPDAVTDRYNVNEPSSATGMISCVLQDADQVLSNIEGVFTGYLQNLIGHRKTLKFRPALENGAVTYIANYERTSTSPVRFWMTVSAGESTYQFDFQDPSE